MKITIGRHAGFCRGVKAAVDAAFACARESSEEIFTDGDLVHNPQTLQMLREQNVRVLDDDEFAKTRGKTVIVRAHGVPPDRLHQLRSQAGKVVNLTCKDVGRVQGLIRRHTGRGGTTVIFGKQDHPEVIGLLGYAGGRGFVIGDLDDLAGLPELDKALLVSQTTMDRQAFAAVCEALLGRFPSAEIVNTICDATELRQNEVLTLARANDCVLVIGGSNSSNTRRLAEIAGKITRVYLISNVDDVGKIGFDNIDKLAVTAGASTPDWLIEEVVEEVRRATQGRFLAITKNFLLFFLYSNLSVALGGFFLAFAVADNIGQPFSFATAFLFVLYYLAMSLMNCYTNRVCLSIDNAQRYQFMYQRRRVFGVIFVVAALGFFLIAVRLGYSILALSACSLLLGVLYNLGYYPIPVQDRRLLFYRRVVLALKSLVISFAVTILLNGLAVLNLEDTAIAVAVLASPGFWISCALIFLLVFTRQALLEIKSAQTDTIAGVSSLLDLVRERDLLVLLFVLPGLLALGLVAGVVLGSYPPTGLKYLVAIGWDCFVVLLSRHSGIIGGRLVFEILVESNVYVVGLIALV